MEAISDQNKGVLDLSKRGLQKIPKHEDAASVKHLILDENELQKIENLDSYLKIEKLSINRNLLLRMYNVCRLHNLRELNLASNGILTIEGLKELTNLRHLNLEGNSIKTIEHLHTNTKLEYLNLSANSIGLITDISFLKCLKELHLHDNRIVHLQNCDKHLPHGLETLTLAKNQIADLNEICTLSHLSNLNSITLTGNPCVQMSGAASLGFDYRPFVLNWCMSVKIIDGFVVNPIESLKAEWLYSQGRGRQFRVGEQDALARYLASVCPLTGEALENETDRKLRLILSKAQQHQRQLQEQISDPNSTTTSPATLRRRSGSSRIQSPRISRLSGGRNKSPDTSMSSSYHGSIMSHSMTASMNNSGGGIGGGPLEMTKSLIENFTSDLMSQSMDSSTLEFSTRDLPNSRPEIASLNGSARDESPTNRSVYNDQPIPPTIHASGPLTAASKMVPVPETLMSPDCPPKMISHLPQKAKTTAAATTKSPKMAKKPVVVSSPRKSASSARQASPKPSALAKESPKRQTTTVPSLTATVALSRSSVTSTPPPTDSPASLSDDDDDESDLIQPEKLKRIRNKAAEKTHKQTVVARPTPAAAAADEHSAILIQKMWRGYNARKKSRVAEKLQRKRTSEYIKQLTKDMEMTKTALENEKKIQQLQMQAINALWKKVATLQPGAPVAAAPAAAATVDPDATTADSIRNSESISVVQDLTKTCSLLMAQVQQLQTSMRDMVACMSAFAQFGVTATLPPPMQESSEAQTDIVAVLTPLDPGFPFSSTPGGKKMLRPASLPISSSTEASPKNRSTATEDESCVETLVLQVIETKIAEEEAATEDNDRSEDVDETIADAPSLCTEN